jgi:shikimate dehydrogenase
VKWRLGVVGSPIAHSLSPQLHEAGLRILGLQGTTQRVEVHQDQGNVLRTLIEQDFDALSVTMPLKYVAGGVCDGLDETARRTGSVNTLLRKDAVTLGRSTDGDGFVNSVAHDFDMEMGAKNVAVLGSGGAAVAIIDALMQHEVASLTLLARNRNAEQALIAKYPTVTSTLDHVGHFDLVVNTVPASAESGLGQLPKEHLDHSTICVDIGYEPRATEWLRAVNELGCQSANGLSMLAHQAQLQMEWWFHESLPIEDLLGAIA